MILLKQGLIVQGEKTETILRWVVWFLTPFGITPSLSQAIEHCEQVDLDPGQCVVPITVAESETLYEVCGK